MIYFMKTIFAAIIFTFQIALAGAAPFAVTEDFKGTATVGGGDVTLPIPKGSLVEISNYDSSKAIQLVEFNTFKIEIPTKILEAPVLVQAAPPTPKQTEEEAPGKTLMSAVEFPKDPVVWKVDTLSFLVNGSADVGIWAPPPQVSGYKGVLILLPGSSDNPFLWVKDRAWQAFAKEQSLILLGVVFSQKGAGPQSQNSVPVSPSSPQVVRFVNENLEEGIKKLETASGLKVPYQRRFLVYGYQVGVNVFEEIRGTPEFPDDQIIAVATAPYSGFSNLKKMGETVPLLICTSKLVITQDPEMMRTICSQLKKGAPWTMALAPVTYGATTPGLSRCFFSYYLKSRADVVSVQLKPAIGRSVDDKDKSVSSNPLNFLPEDPVFMEKLQKFRAGAPYSPDY